MYHPTKEATIQCEKCFKAVCSGDIRKYDTKIVRGGTRMYKNFCPVCLKNVYGTYRQIMTVLMIFVVLFLVLPINYFLITAKFDDLFVKLGVLTFFDIILGIIFLGMFFYEKSNFNKAKVESEKFIATIDESSMNSNSLDTSNSGQSGDAGCYYHPQRSGIFTCSDCNHDICLADKRVYFRRSGNFTRFITLCPICYKNKTLTSIKKGYYIIIGFFVTLFGLYVLITRGTFVLLEMLAFMEILPIVMAFFYSIRSYFRYNQLNETENDFLKSNPLNVNV